MSANPLSSHNKPQRPPGGPTVPSRRLLPLALLSVGMLGVIAAWSIIAYATDSRAGWMALVVAVDAALLLRIGKYPAGNERISLALLTTLLGILAGYWLVAALPIAEAMGQLPFVTARHMGWDFAWTVIRLGNTPLDWICGGIGLLLAAWLVR